MKILAVDFGDARTGLATCDKLEMLASPVGVIQEKRFEQAVEKTAAALSEQRAELAVVGLPLNMDGSEGERAQLCREFAEKLQELTGVRTVMWDERRTTVSAANYLNQTDTRGKKRKAIIDAVSAVIILESYMAYRRNHPGEDVLDNNK